MTLVLPLNYDNTRFTFSVTGLTDTFGFSLGSPPLTGHSALETATGLSGTWSTLAIGDDAFWNDEFTYLGTTTTRMTPSGPLVATFPVSIQGTNAVDAPPVNTAILVNKITALGGRENRGRLYIPSGKIEEGNVNAAGFITPTVVTAINNQLGDWYAAIVAFLGVPPVLFHSDVATALTDIEVFTVSSQVATQRRRMR